MHYCLSRETVIRVLKMRGTYPTVSDCTSILGKNQVATMAPLVEYVVTDSV